MVAVSHIGCLKTSLKRCWEIPQKSKKSSNMKWWKWLESSKKIREAAPDVKDRRRVLLHKLHRNLLLLPFIREGDLAHCSLQAICKLLLLSFRVLMRRGGASWSVFHLVWKATIQEKIDFPNRIGVLDQHWKWAWKSPWKLGAKLYLFPNICTGKIEEFELFKKKIVPASDMMLLNSNPKSLQHRKSHFQFSRDNISDQMSP